MEVVHVAVGVVSDPEGNILIGRRRPDSHQGGLWEFPGGKVKAGETVRQALQRELLEELGIAIGPATPLIAVEHDYGDRRVLLDVWRVASFEGEARGLEGQSLVWVPPATLNEYPFPAANAPIVDALLDAG